MLESVRSKTISASDISVSRDLAKAGYFMIFLSDSLSGAPQCYSELNVVGDGAGNCGYSRGAFLPCDPEHAQCGQLQCEEGTFVRGGTTGSFTIFRNFLGNSICRSFTTNPNSDTINPGLVQDGTKCANESVS